MCWRACRTPQRRVLELARLGHWQWDGLATLLASRGHRVLMPEFRGSTEEVQEVQLPRPLADPDRDAELLREISPVVQAARIRAPLLLPPGRPRSPGAAASW